MQPVAMKFQFIGSGDAFGTGGRFNTCFRVEHSGGAFLIDCGASSMVAIRRAGVDPNSIDAIFITHLHGDHFAGLPFFLLDAQLYSKRTKRLTIAGPYGLEERLMQAQEVLFPGSSETKLKFEVELIEIAPGEKRGVHGVGVEAYPMRHPCGAPPLGLRLSVGGKTVAYTGDTEWNDDIIPLGRGADLLVLECLFHEKSVPHHLNHAVIVKNLDRIGARRVVLTHFGPEMMANRHLASEELAEDGKVIEL
jgi:ribonuclease BN (tRNA processing enzyme)